MYNIFFKLNFSNSLSSVHTVLYSKLQGPYIFCEYSIYGTFRLKKKAEFENLVALSLKLQVTTSGERMVGWCTKGERMVGWCTKGERMVGWCTKGERMVGWCTNCLRVRGW